MPQRDNIKFFEENRFSIDDGAVAIKNSFDFNTNPFTIENNPANRVIVRGNNEPVTVDHDGGRRASNVVISTRSTPVEAEPFDPETEEEINLITTATRTADGIFIGNAGSTDILNPSPSFTESPWTEETQNRVFSFSGAKLARVRAIRRGLRGIFIPTGSTGFSLIAFTDSSTTDTGNANNPAFLHMDAIRIDGRELFLLTDANGLRLDNTHTPLTFPQGTRRSQIVLTESAPYGRVGISALGSELRNMNVGATRFVTLNFRFSANDPSVDEGYLLDITQPVQPPPSQPIFDKREADTIILRGVRSNNILSAAPLDSEMVIGPQDVEIRMNVLRSEFLTVSLQATIHIAEEFTLGGHNYGRTLLCGDYLTHHLSMSFNTWDQQTLDRDYAFAGTARQAKIEAIRDRMRGFMIPSNPHPTARNGGSVLLAETEEPLGTNVNPLTYLNYFHMGADLFPEIVSGQANFINDGGSVAGGVRTRTVALQKENGDDFLFDDLPDWLTSRPNGETVWQYTNYGFTEAGEPTLPSRLFNFSPTGVILTDPSSIDAHKDNRFGDAGIVELESISYDHDWHVSGEGQIGRLGLRFTAPVANRTFVDGPNGLNTWSARINNYITHSRLVTNNTGGVIGLDIHVGYETRRIIDMQRAMTEEDNNNPRNISLNVNFSYVDQSGVSTFADSNNYMFRNRGGSVTQIPALPHYMRIDSIAPEIPTTAADSGPWIEMQNPFAPVVSAPSGTRPPQIRSTTIQSQSILLNPGTHDTFSIKFNQSFTFNAFFFSKYFLITDRSPIEVKEVILTNSIGELKGYPEIKQFPFTQNETSVVTKDGRFFINKQRGTVKRIDLTGKNYTQIDDIYLLEELFERDFPFLVWINGGHQHFRFPIPGFRSRDIYKMQTRGDFRVGLSKGSYRGLINFRMSLVESI